MNVVNLLSRMSWIFTHPHPSPSPQVVTKAVTFDPEGAMRRAIANNKVYSMCPNTITFVLAGNDFMLLKKSILRFLENTKFFLRFCTILS